jgi:hypothetical protein
VLLVLSQFPAVSPEQAAVLTIPKTPKHAIEIYSVMNQYIQLHKHIAVTAFITLYLL